jgi:hypothetical protein
MDRLTEIKKANGLKDEFYIKYLNEKLVILRKEYSNCKSKDHNYVMLVRKNITETKYCLKRANGIGRKVQKSKKAHKIHTHARKNMIELKIESV